MFNHTLRLLRELEQGKRLSVTLPLDDEGYLDRQCPDEECHTRFKVLDEDWRDKVADERVWCPLCRQEAPATDWNTDEQVEHAKAVVLAHLEQSLNAALTQDARSFNRAQRPGFIELSMSVQPGAVPVIVPLDAAKAMRQKYTCSACGCRYAAIGVTFFCPACGHSSVVEMFDQTVNAVRQIVTAAVTMRAALVHTHGDDVAENSVRYFMEDNLGRLVGAFQHCADGLFDRLPNAASYKRRRNVFQNLQEGSDLWRAATGKGYGDILDTAKLAELEVLFQRRHLLAHRNGLVDQDYIDKSGDRGYAIGQRVVIREGAVLSLADLILSLVNGLRHLV